MALEITAAGIIVGLVVLVIVAMAVVVRRKGRRAEAPDSSPRRVSEQPVAEAPPSPTALPESKPQPSESIAAQPRLIATGGPLSQQTYTIPSQGLSIGRHSDNDVVLADELMVSRYHAVITPEQGQYVLYDRDSANGTWVNEQRVFRHVLAPGDRIQIWNSQFAYSPHDRVPPQPPPEPSPSPTIHVVGECFCGYQLESLIGRGGMSEVYKARDSQGRTKSIRAPFSEMDTVKIVGQVCSALAFAHENSVVHRDIKPENILVGTDGVAKVLDFGIAKLTSASTVTRDKIVGTPEYISPEQARGDPVQPASDVYSLGILLYEMLTGSVPFRRPRTEEPFKAAIDVIRQHLKEDPEPIHQRNPTADVSPRMEQATMQALKKDLNERFATAKELGEAMGYQEPPDRITTSVRPVQASLVIVQGPCRGQRISLSSQTLPLGRRELGSSNATISRRHANIIFRGGSYWLEDISKNGTWVDNTRVYGEAPLVNGSVVVIGDNVLRLEQSLL
jgi:pSer/pThr/pTyr-binding forkhead associated (FHA) protein